MSTQNHRLFLAADTQIENTDWNPTEPKQQFHSALSDWHVDIMWILNGCCQEHEASSDLASLVGLFSVQGYPTVHPILVWGWGWEGLLATYSLLTIDRFYLLLVSLPHARYHWMQAACSCHQQAILCSLEARIWLLLGFCIKACDRLSDHNFCPGICS